MGGGIEIRLPRDRPRERHHLGERKQLRRGGDPKERLRRRKKVPLFLRILSGEKCKKKRIDERVPTKKKECDLRPDTAAREPSEWPEKKLREGKPRERKEGKRPCLIS